jgi:hypothetical protein
LVGLIFDNLFQNIELTFFRFVFVLKPGFRIEFDESNKMKRVFIDDDDDDANDEYPKFFCHDDCPCFEDCRQRMPRLWRSARPQLQVMRSAAMGFGVRCSQTIEKDELVCFYIGEVIDDARVAQRRALALRRAIDVFCRRHNCSADDR